MSWIQQESRRRQGSWVAAMPRPALVGYRSQAQQCPLVGLVGACCSGCAEGKGCAAKGELEHAHVGATGYPSSDADTFDAEVQKLNAAISTAGGPSLQTQWAGFYGSWNAWLAEYRSAWLTLGIIGEGFADKFDEYRRAYNDLLEKSRLSGVPSTATPVDFRSPAAKAAQGALDAAGNALGGVTGALTTALTWVAIAGGVGLVLYLGAPVLLSRLKK